MYPGEARSRRHQNLEMAAFEGRADFDSFGLPASNWKGGAKISNASTFGRSNKIYASGIENGSEEFYMNGNNTDEHFSDANGTRSSHRFPLMDDGASVMSGDAMAGRAMSISSMNTSSSSPAITALAMMNTSAKKNVNSQYRQKVIESRKALLSAEAGLIAPPTRISQQNRRPAMHSIENLSMHSPITSQHQGMHPPGPPRGPPPHDYLRSRSMTNVHQSGRPSYHPPQQQQWGRQGPQMHSQMGPGPGPVHGPPRFSGYSSPMTPTSNYSGSDRSSFYPNTYPVRPPSHGIPYSDSSAPVTAKPEFEMETSATLTSPIHLAERERFDFEMDPQSSRALNGNDAEQKSDPFTDDSQLSPDDDDDEDLDLGEVAKDNPSPMSSLTPRHADAEIEALNAQLLDEVRVLAIELAESARRELQLNPKSDQALIVSEYAKVQNDLTLERKKRLAAEKFTHVLPEQYTIIELEHRYAEAAHMLNMLNQEHNTLQKRFASVSKDLDQTSMEVQELREELKQIKLEKAQPGDADLLKHVEMVEEENRKLQKILDESSDQGPLGQRLRSVEDQRDLLQEALRTTRERKDYEINLLRERLESARTKLAKEVLMRRELQEHAVMRSISAGSTVAGGRGLDDISISSYDSESTAHLHDQSDTTTAEDRSTESPLDIPRKRGNGRLGSPLLLNFDLHHLQNRSFTDEPRASRLAPVPLLLTGN